MGKIIIATKFYIRESRILRANPSNSSEKTLKIPMNSSPWPIVRLFPRRVIIFKPLCIMNVPTAKLSCPSSHLPIKNIGKCPRGDSSLMVEHSAWWTSYAESPETAPGQEALRASQASWKWMLTEHTVSASSPQHLPQPWASPKKAGMLLGWKTGNKASKKQSKKSTSFWGCSFILLGC